MNMCSVSRHEVKSKTVKNWVLNATWEKTENPSNLKDGFRQTKAEVKGYDWAKEENRIFIQVLYCDSVLFTLNGLSANLGRVGRLLQVTLLKVYKQEAALLSTFCTHLKILGCMVLFRSIFK